jgi:plasmid stabilization system protein ParE
MTQRVIISDRAESDINTAHRWWAEHRSPEQAARWYAGITDAIYALSKSAERHGLALENDGLPFEARQLLFGLGRKLTHRVLFTIRPDCVYVLRVVHVAQDVIDLGDL